MSIQIYIAALSIIPSLLIAAPQNEEAAINALYREWSQATASRGAQAYIEYFVEDGAILPPDSPAAEGRQAIYKWIEKSLHDYTVKDVKMTFAPLRIAEGWATRRFTITGLRVPKQGGEPIRFHSKYLDVLQKQADGSWKFVYRMWSNNE